MEALVNRGCAVKPLHGLFFLYNNLDVLQFDWSRKIAETFINQENEVRWLWILRHSAFTYSPCTPLCVRMLCQLRPMLILSAIST